MKQTEELAVIGKAKELIEFTYKITANVASDSNRQALSIVDKIERLSMCICESLIYANECNMLDFYEKPKRLDFQQKVIVLCKMLNALIALSYRLKIFNISSESVESWCGLSLEIKRMTAAWRNNDRRQHDKQNTINNGE